jgi:hypothetical protein
MLEVLRRSASANIQWWQWQLECADDLLEHSVEWFDWLNPMRIF